MLNTIIKSGEVIMTASIENDGVIDLIEAENIRVEWEQMKSSAESFVVACEKGLYVES